MAKREFCLSEAEERIFASAFVNCKDGPTRTRYQAVRLYGKGYSAREIEAITGTCHSTLMEWCRKYRQGGLDALGDHRIGGNRALLSGEQIEALGQRLRTYRPEQLFGAEATSSDGQFWTIADLARAVEQWYGVRYLRQSSYQQLLKRCGFSYQRPTKVYKSRSEAQVQAFEEDLLKKR
jgi:transposase